MFCISTAFNYFFFTDSTGTVLANSTPTSEIILSNISLSYRSVTDEKSTKINIYNDATVTNVAIDNNVLGNNANVLISLFGIFVLFFSLFVLTYVYFKFFRKNVHASRTKENEWKLQYQSLNLEASELERREQPVEQVQTDSAYLFPVFSLNDNSETRGFQENDIGLENDEALRETRRGEHTLIYGTTNSDNEPNNILEIQTKHVYTEITC